MQICLVVWNILRYRQGLCPLCQLLQPRVLQQALLSSDTSIWEDYSSSIKWILNLPFGKCCICLFRHRKFSGISVTENVSYYYPKSIYIKINVSLFSIDTKIADWFCCCLCDTILDIGLWGRFRFIKHHVPSFRNLAVINYVDVSQWIL